jgi:hypothetical protein
MQFDALCHFLFSDSQSDQLSWSHDENLVIVAWISAWYHSNSMNIDPIAHLRTGDEIRHQFANCTYSSCCYTIRTQIVNSSQSCRNCKMELRSGSNPSPIPVATPVSWVTTRTGPQPGNPELLLTLDLVNLVTVTKTNRIDEMLCRYRTLKSTGVKIWHQVSRRACAVVPAALQVPRRPAHHSQQLHNLTILILNLVASWMHPHRFRCFEEHVRMLLQSLRALCKGPGGAGSIWEYLEAVVRATRVSRMFPYGFQTELHFTDIRHPWRCFVRLG